MNRQCSIIIMLLYAVAVIVFLAAAFGGVPNPLQLVAVGLAIAALAALFKTRCCDCPKG